MRVQSAREALRHLDETVDDGALVGVAWGEDE
jgi:DNA-binding transcriptional regulator LsrR (DeoR family)